MGHFKLVQSGRMVETYSFSKSIHQKRYGSYIKSCRREPDKEASKTRPRREDSIRRATKSFRRLVTSNLSGSSNPVLLTLTILSILSLKTSRSFLRRFLNRLEALNKAPLKYIAVPEWQQRGAVHFHILLWGLDSETSCTGHYKKIGKRSFFIETCDPGKQCERKTRNIQRLWLRGFCDCIATDGSPKLSGYLTKYMSKGLRDKRLRGERAYSVSRNVMRPVSTKIPQALVEDVLEQVVGAEANPTHVHTFETQWLGTCTYSRYDIDIGKAPEGA